MSDAPHDSEAAVVAEALDVLLASYDPAGDVASFLAARFDAGLAWVGAPVGAGGLGLDWSHQRRVDTALAAVGAPDPYMNNAIAVGMAAPAILTHGTAAQHQRWLRPLYCGDDRWCQLFSEPDAGSDLAGLATRAVRDGDHWVVDGQKVWNTLAHHARWGILATRTDPDVPKHRGLTYFVVDMTTPGVDVRPLRQMTGDAEFNEVHLDAVRVPDDQRIGPVGGGWAVVLTTLMSERASIGAGSADGSGLIDWPLQVWRDHGGTAVQRDRLGGLLVRAEVLRCLALRSRALSVAGSHGPDGSLLKLSQCELNRDVMEFAMDLMGAEAMLYGDYSMTRPETPGLHHDDPRTVFLRTRAQTIEGGSSEVMRNIIGERILGLAPEPRTDKDVPWRDVPRSTGIAARI